MNNESCLLRIKEKYHKLPESSKKIADYILNNTAKSIFFSVSELSQECKVSDASIIRFCKQLGYIGYNEFKIYLTFDVDIGGSEIFEDVNTEDDGITVLKKVFQNEINALESTRNKININEIQKALNAIANCRKIELFATGNAKPIIYDANYRFCCIGLDAKVGIDEYDSMLGASRLRVGDVAIAVTHSGTTLNTIKMLKLAHDNGATTICITGNNNGSILEYSDIVLLTSSQETAFRSVAMSSRIAQMAIIDALVVGVAFKQYETSKRNIKNTNLILAEGKE